MAAHDIAIIGGGPAGSVAAILLARRGAKVVLVDPSAARDRVEGLSPRVIEILAAHGLETAAVEAPVQRVTAWGGERTTLNREHPVRRPAFDAGLRAQAAREQVTLVSARAGRLGAGRAEVPGETIRAGLVVDARGRAAAACGGLRGPATVAIAGWAAADGEPGASVEARPEGWIWRVAQRRGEPRRASRARSHKDEVPAPNRPADRLADGTRRAAWVQIVRDARGLGCGASGLAEAWTRILGDAAPSGLTARSAELRLTAAELDPGLPRIGDAAVAMDPLSGHGVFWAISSALAASPMLQAILDGETELARAFYRARVAAQFWRQARIGRDFHRMAGFDTPFWRARAGWPDDAPAHGGAEQISGGMALRRQVVVRDGRLVEAEALVTPRDPDGVAFVAGREIAPVLRRLGAWPLPGRAEFCARILPEAPPAQAGLIHDWLTDRGVGGLPQADGEQGREVRA